MWIQTKAGIYENGKDVIKVEELGHDSYMVSKNKDVLDYLESAKEVNDFLKSIGLENVCVPKMVNKNSEWQSFDGSDDSYTKAYSRKDENGEIQTVILHKMDDEYSVYLWIDECSNEDDYYLQNTLKFAEEKNRNAINDLELHVFEGMKHGASGMDDRDYDLKYNDMVKLLKTKYGIK